ncbi:HD-GYP domain-containing protein [Desulfuribacillus alkaliarsenatis]|uniref:HD-GYP domain-containing protein n=1 Tax=Desulfuribacillus alkaliarsenatis TaxID=766136 RepID=A0A1E5G6L8_9FIRM|nr:HD-GYP domain-containing protein [Desulfuribacillus alkaliarsenatis]OEF98394.1 hypothetical protein BHF68_01575 [Desulfuribacillus alkaliarsenatis]
MIEKDLSYMLVNDILAKDLENPQTGLLLLSKGHRLRATDITLLIKNNVSSVIVETDDKKIADSIIHQIHSLWSNVNKEFNDGYIENINGVKQLFANIVEGNEAKLEEVFDNYLVLLEGALARGYLLHVLHKIRGYDDYTYRHSLNVSLISGIIGKLMGLSLEDITNLSQAGLLHDIGKVKINEQIIGKKGPLTDDEYNKVQFHTTFGYEVLQDLGNISMKIQTAALAHHERLNGSGYPLGLKGDEIPLYAQIIAVADTYDAICSDRVYKKKESPFVAIDELTKGMYEGKYSVEIVTKFTYFLISGYVGYEVILNNKIRAKILLVHNEEPLRPLLQIDKEYIDLRKRRDLAIKEIIL